MSGLGRQYEKWPRLGFENECDFLLTLAPPCITGHHSWSTESAKVLSCCWAQGSPSSAAVAAVDVAAAADMAAAAVEAAAAAAAAASRCAFAESWARAVASSDREGDLEEEVTAV